MDDLPECSRRNAERSILVDRVPFLSLDKCTYG
jgi:hypothetical protein